jgi:5-methyltetrahydropteroyltriglutamate--homocysteine methyltransferase
MKHNQLQTTIAGSLPKPSWLAEPLKLWAPWKFEGKELAEAQQDAVRLVLRAQEKAGIDIVSDGEQTRQHFVTTFIQRLSGIDFNKSKTIRIRDRYDADVPVVTGPVTRTLPIYVKDARFLRAETDRRVKYTLPGPMTMVDTLYDDYYHNREKLAWEFARILNQEAREIADAGIDVIQFDEPAFNVFFDDVRDWGIKTLERAAQNLTCKTAVHICYGYGIKQNTDWKASLGSEWRQYENTFPLLQASTIDQVSLECHNSNVPMALMDLLKGKDVLVGVIDVTTNQIETPEEVAATIRKALAYVTPEKLYPCTNCGMVPLPRKVARDKLKALSAGTAIIREELA